MLTVLTPPDLVRFWSKVDVRSDDECWPWIAKAKNPAGYGVLKHKSGKNFIASRISCFIAHGAPPHPSAKSLHSCDNPPCCNPNHLRWGTSKDNVRDAQERGRHVDPPRVTDSPEWEAKRKAAMPKGNAVHNSKLSEPVVREIWRLHFEGKNASEISAAVGYSIAAVYDVCRGRSWRHLPNAPTVDALKDGGVRRGAVNQFSKGGDTRALNSRTKIPTAEIPNILSRLASGESLKAVGETYGVTKHAIFAIKTKHAG